MGRVVFCFCLLAGAHRSAQADFAVLTNRSPATVVCKLAGEAAGKEGREFQLPSGDTVPIPLSGPTQLSFGAADRPKTYRVVPNGMYYFAETRPGQLDLHQIGLGAHEVARPVPHTPERLSDPLDDAPDRSGSVVIPVKILFDEDEVTPRAPWERRIRARFDEASRVFEKQCFVRFKIVAIESWRSEDTLTNLEELLGEFEREVDPAPARIAIGFTGQYKARQQYLHLGGTRGPLHTHLLIREWVNHNSEAERLEVLIHELGHFLGAVHSPESTSVMRSVLGDRQAREVKFRIGFDPLNTLAMCLLGQELKARPILRLADLQPTTQAELRKLYSELSRALPDDPTALRYLRLLNPMGQIPEPTRP